MTLPARLHARLYAHLRRWLHPDLCARCGLVWAAVPGDSRPARPAVCPCCGFAPGG